MIRGSANDTVDKTYARAIELFPKMDLETREDLKFDMMCAFILPDSTDDDGIKSYVTDFVRNSRAR